VDWYEDRHPAGTSRFFEAFETARRILSIFPNAGRPRNELRQRLRSYVVHPYIVFYTVHEKRVLVERILHGHIDIDATEFVADV
jgi:plasmid stabilization system protein ParE